jgi:hypothetical protein
MLASSIVFSLLTTALLWLARRRNLASDPRITLAALMILLALPLMSFAPKFVMTGTPLLPQQLGNQGPEYLGLFFTIWIIGLGLGLARTRSSLSVFRKWKKRSFPIPDRSPFVELCQDLKENAQIEIRVHRRWSSQTLRMALLHELCHIQRRDLWMASLAHLVCLLHWFNPAVWWLRRTLLSQCEYACDAHIIREGTNPREYAHALCDVAQCASKPTYSLAMAEHAPLRDRILRLSNKQSHSKLLTTSLWLSASSAIALSLVEFSPASLRDPQQLQIPVSIEAHLRFSADPFPAD